MNRRDFHRTALATAVAAVTPTAPAAGPSPTPAVAPVAALTESVPAGAAARLGCNRLWHVWPASNPGLNDLAFSPDGRYLASVGYQDDRVFVWSIPDGRLVHHFEPQSTDRNATLAWCAAGLYVATSEGLSLWDAPTGTLVRRYTTDSAAGVSVSADGRYVATSTYIHGGATLYDTRIHEPVASFVGETATRSPRNPYSGDFLNCVALSRCGRWLVAGGTGSTGTSHAVLHFWDIAAKRHLVRVDAGSGHVGRVAFTRSGKVLAAAWNGVVSLWDMPAGRKVREWPQPCAVGGVYCGLHANARGDIVVAGAEGVYLRHPDPEKERLLCPATGYPHVAYSDDGKFVACGGRSGRIHLYDAATGDDVSPGDRHDDQVGGVQLDASGRVALVFFGRWMPRDQPPVVALRDTATGERLSLTLSEGFRTVALSPDGGRIAGTSAEGRVAVFDRRSGEIRPHPEWYADVMTWADDSRRLLLFESARCVVESWDCESGERKRQPTTIPAVVSLASAGGCAAALGMGGEVEVWSLDGGEVRRWHLEPGERSDFDRPSLALSPDGSRVAATTIAGVVWAGADADEALAVVYRHPSHEDTEDGHTLRARFTTDGRLVAVGGETALIDNEWQYTHVVHDLDAGIAWRSPPQVLWSGARAVTPDGSRLVTGEEDGTLLVWPVAPVAARAVEKPPYSAVC